MTEEEEDNLESEYFKSQEFEDGIEKIIQRDTWDKGLPRVYLDSNGNIVKHWKDGTVKIIKESDRL